MNYEGDSPVPERAESSFEDSGIDSPSIHSRSYSNDRREHISACQEISRVTAEISRPIAGFLNVEKKNGAFPGDSSSCGLDHHLESISESESKKTEKEESRELQNLGKATHIKITPSLQPQSNGTGDASNEKIGDHVSHSIQDRLCFLEQESEAKTKHIESLEKKIEVLQQALAESQALYRKISIEHQICQEQLSGLAPSELEKTRQENQILRNEILEKASEIKNLKNMFVTLGKEKEIMSKELTLKTRLLSEMEEHVNDIKARNQALASRLENYVKESRAKIRDCQGTIASLQNRNKELTDHLLKSAEACRMLKSKYRDAQEQNKAKKEENAMLKDSMEKYEQLSVDSEVEKRTLKREIDQLKADMEKVKIRYRELQEQMKNIQEESLRLRTENIFLLQEASYERGKCGNASGEVYQVPETSQHLMPSTEDHGSP